MQTVYTDTSVLRGCFDDEFKGWSNALMNSFSSYQKICVLPDLLFGDKIMQIKVAEAAESLLIRM